MSFNPVPHPLFSSFCIWLLVWIVPFSRLICWFYFTCFEKNPTLFNLNRKKKLCHHLLSKSYKHFYIFDFQYKSCVRVALYTKKRAHSTDKWMLLNDKYYKILEVFWSVQSLTLFSYNECAGSTCNILQI